MCQLCRCRTLSGSLICCFPPHPFCVGFALIFYLLPVHVRSHFRPTKQNKKVEFVQQPICETANGTALQGSGGGSRAGPDSRWEAGRRLHLRQRVWSAGQEDAARAQRSLSCSHLVSADRTNDRRQSEKRLWSVDLTLSCHSTQTSGRYILCQSGNLRHWE